MMQRLLSKPLDYKLQVKNTAHPRDVCLNIKKISSVLIGNLKQRLKIKFENDIRLGTGFAQTKSIINGCEITIFDSCQNLTFSVSKAAFQRINLLLLIPSNQVELFNLIEKIPSHLPFIVVKFPDVMVECPEYNILHLNVFSCSVTELASLIYDFLVEYAVKNKLLRINYELNSSDPCKVL